MLIEYTIKGPPQSGKTTMALGALDALHRAGVGCILLAPTVEWAVDVSHRKGLKHACMAFPRAVENPPPSWRAIVVDDAEMCPNLEEGLTKLRAHLKALPGPTQLIIVRAESPPLVGQLREYLDLSKYSGHAHIPKALLQEAIDSLVKYTSSTRDVHLPGEAHVAVADEENRTSGPFASK